MAENHDLAGRSERSAGVVCLLLILGLFWACEKQEREPNRFRDWQKDGQSGQAGTKAGQKSPPRMRPPSVASQTPKKEPTKSQSAASQSAASQSGGKDTDLLNGGGTREIKPARMQEWLQPPFLDLGKHRAGAPVKGRYEFKNPTGKEMKILNIASSCTCQSLELVLSDRRIPVRKGMFKPILIPAGAKGFLDFQVEATDALRKVYVTLTTSDPENPQVTVEASILGVRDFQILKADREVRDYHLGLMKRRESRQIELRVKSTDGKPFEILGHEPFPEGLDLEASKDPKDPSSWWLRGTFRAPQKAGANTGGKVVYKTDRSLGFDFEVTAMVLAPVRVLPKTVQSLSGVPQGESRSAEWTLVGLDAETRVEATKAWFELDTNSKAKLEGRISAKEFKVDAQLQQEGHRLQVRVSTPAGLPPGLFMGNVLVQFQDKTLSPVSLRLMVQVRRARR